MSKTLDQKALFAARDKDWRYGAIVYQVFVDRFAPAIDIEKKLDVYAYPKKLMKWTDLPKPGPYDPNTKYTTHELEYWGGDLASLLGRMDYLNELEIDVLYLNPIVKSLSNHKYDASDYLQISPEYGTFADLKKLADSLHLQNKKLILDGVFNHVGVTSELFESAKDPKSEKHAWFDFNPNYPEGVRLWADARTLPELNLENPEVQDYIYKGRDSVIRSYLKNGADGWRLDVAFDIGFKYLKEITEAAHDELSESIVIGEIWNYPQDWLKSIDGVMNFTFREIILNSVKGIMSPDKANRALERVVSDSGIDGILKSWNVLDNHDTPRLQYQLPDPIDQKLAQIMQFTLPGSPNLYYGTELGMNGGNDPLNRAPMNWDLYQKDNSYLTWTKSLIDLHHQERALRIGDHISLLADGLIAFERRTDHVDETVIVLINPSNKSVTESILVPDSKLMNYSNFDLVMGSEIPVQFLAGFLNVTLEAKSYSILKPRTKPTKSYTPYKRV